MAMFAAILRASSLLRQLGGRSPPRLIHEIDIGELLPGAVLHDEAGVVEFFDRPERRGSGGRSMQPLMHDEPQPARSSVEYNST